MTSRLILIVVIGLTTFSCNSGRDSSVDEITGAYAVEYSFRVTNPETGTEIGMSTLRDTIFIRFKQEGYEVSNNKWRLNHYDREGWKNLEHSEDKPLPTYHAVFDPTNSSLNAELFIPLYLNLKEGKLRKGKKGNINYAKVFLKNNF